GQVVVAMLERAHALGRFRSSEHDHGAVTDATAVERGRVAEHEHVRLGCARELVGILEGEDVEAVARQLLREEPAHGSFGLGEHHRGLAATVATVVPARQMFLRAGVWLLFYTRPLRTPPDTSPRPTHAE